MKIDAEAATTLKAVIEADLKSIAANEVALAALPALLEDERDLIVAGYHLHNIYNAMENTFEQISRTFENHIKDPTRWHRELLDKMFLNLSPLRPAVLSERVRQLSHDLRGFRHFFRHSYGLGLETCKLAALRDRWQAEGPLAVEALQRFAHALAAKGGL